MPPGRSAKQALAEKQDTISPAVSLDLVRSAGSSYQCQGRLLGVLAMDACILEPLEEEDVMAIDPIKRVPGQMPSPRGAC